MSEIINNIILYDIIKTIEIGNEGMYGKYPNVTITFENNTALTINLNEKNYKLIKKFLKKYEVIGNRWYEKQKTQKKIREWKRKAKEAGILYAYLCKNNLKEYSWFYEKVAFYNEKIFTRET